MDAKLFTPEEAAKLLRLGRSMLFQLMADGSIPSITIGRCRRITPEALDRFIERRQGIQTAGEAEATRR